MKKGLLIVAILLFLAGGVALAFAYERFSVAADRQQAVDHTMKRIESETDKARMEELSEYLEMDAIAAGDARRMGWLGLGAGGVLMLGSVILFLKSRRPRTAAPG
jgi:hypothetical protein